MTTNNFLKQAKKRVESAILSTYKDVGQVKSFALSLEVSAPGKYKATYEVYCFCMHRHYVMNAYVDYDEINNSWSVR